MTIQSINIEKDIKTLHGISEKASKAVYKSEDYNNAMAEELKAKIEFQNKHGETALINFMLCKTLKTRLGKAVNPTNRLMNRKTNSTGNGYGNM